MKSELKEYDYSSGSNHDSEIESKLLRIKGQLPKERTFHISSRTQTLQKQTKQTNFVNSQQLNLVSHLYDERIDYDKLETVYFDHPLATRGTNSIITDTLAAGYSFNSDDEKAKELIEEWTKNLTVSFNDLLELVLQNKIVGGNSFVELIQNKGKTRILDLAIIPAGSIDFQRYLDGKIVRDFKTKKPVGWVQVDTDQMFQDVKFAYEDVAHFRLYKLSDDPLGMGLIESAYTVFISLRKIEDSYAEAVYRHGFPNWDITVGTLEYPASAEDKQDADDLSDNIVAGADSFVHGPLIHVDKVESQKMEKIASIMDYFIYMVCAAFGIPRGELLGTGEGTNRATAKELALAKEKHIRALQKSLSETFQDQIFKPVLKKNFNIDAEVWIEFNEARPEDQTLKVERIVKMAQAGMITYDPSLERWYRESEGLPQLETSKGDSDSKPQIPTKGSPAEDEESPDKENMTDEELEKNQPYSSIDPLLNSYLRSLRGKFITLKNTLLKKVVLDEDRLKELLKEEIKQLDKDITKDVNEYLPKAFEKGQDIQLTDFIAGTKKDNKHLLQSYMSDVHLLVTDAEIRNHLIKLNLGYLTDLTELLRSQLFNSLSEGIKAGNSIDELRARVRNIFDTDLTVRRKAYERKNPDGTTTQVKATEMKISLVSRLQMIAIEETRESFRQSRIQYYQKNRPDIPSLTWISLRDDKVCADCRTLQGKSFPINNVPDRPHPRCRCTVAPSRLTPEDPTKVKLPIIGTPKFDRGA